MDSKEILQVFRRRNVIVCVKMVWIAVDIPYTCKIRKAEIVGFSVQRGTGDVFWDIALNGAVVLHILKRTKNRYFQPFYFEAQPL